MNIGPISMLHSFLDREFHIYYIDFIGLVYSKVNMENLGPFIPIVPSHMIINSMTVKTKTMVLIYFVLI